MKKTLMGLWGRTAWSCLGRRIRAEFRQRPVLLMLAAGFTVAVVAKIATAHGPSASGHVGGRGCANQQPGAPYLAIQPSTTPPITNQPATILKLNCGENGIIRPCEDED